MVLLSRPGLVILFIFDLLGNLIITGSALYGNHRSRRAQVPAAARLPSEKDWPEVRVVASAEDINSRKPLKVAPADDLYCGP